MSTPGGPSRAGARRGAPADRGLPAGVLPRTAGALVALVVWMVLVLIAIHFGRLARGGDDEAWWWLALAAAGAVGCLFGSLMLGTAALRRAGLVSARSSRQH